jgi:hypothetical protein
MTFKLRPIRIPIQDRPMGRSQIVNVERHPSGKCSPFGGHTHHNAHQIGLITFPSYTTKTVIRGALRHPNKSYIHQIFQESSRSLQTITVAMKPTEPFH